MANIGVHGPSGRVLIQLVDGPGEPGRPLRDTNGLDCCDVCAVETWACCFPGEPGQPAFCEDLPPDECVAAGGQPYIGQACGEVTCPEDECPPIDQHLLCPDTLDATFDFSGTWEWGFGDHTEVCPVPGTITLDKIVAPPAWGYRSRTPDGQGLPGDADGDGICCGTPQQSPSYPDGWGCQEGSVSLGCIPYLPPGEVIPIPYWTIICRFASPNCTFGDPPQDQVWVHLRPPVARVRRPMPPPGGVRVRARPLVLGPVVVLVVPAVRGGGLVSEFFRSPHCMSHAHCATCRSEVTGRRWRESLVGSFDDLVDDHWECPEGRPWSEQPVRLSLGGKVLSYVRAEASLLVRGPTDEATQEGRAALCRECVNFDATDEGRDGHCVGCGCPAWTRAKMSTKWRMPEARCPRGLWPAIVDSGYADAERQPVAAGRGG